MPWWLLLLPVVGFFTCCCCYCTSCTEAQDAAAEYDVTITGLANNSCTGCANAEGTYHVVQGDNPCGSPSIGGSPRCVYSATQAGDIDCTACPPSGDHSTTISCQLFITSDGAVTGDETCAKTTTEVVLAANDYGCTIISPLQCYMITRWQKTSTIKACDGYAAYAVDYLNGSTANECTGSGSTCTVDSA